MFSIGMVHDQTIEARTVHCLLSMRRYTEGLDEIIMVEGSVGSFDVGRNKIVSHFLDKTDSEWLLTVDSDMYWTSEEMTKLLGYANGYDVVSGCYMVNDKPPRLCAVRRRESGHMTTVAWEELPDVGLMEVDGVGGGCMLIPRSVVEDISHMFGEDTANRGGPWYRQSAVGASGHMLEPDHAFCQRVQQVGRRVYVAPDVFFGHIKPRVLGYE